MRAVLVILVCACTAAAELIKVPTDDAFEKEIMASSKCWAVLFVSAHRDVAEATKNVERLESLVPGLSLASADVDDVKAVCSEFNVRKRMVPRLLVFNSRARQASIVKVSDMSLDDLTAAVNAELTENTKDTEGNYEKLTLAIGGGGEKGEL